MFAIGIAISVPRRFSAETDASGQASFGDLTSGVYAVTTRLDEQDADEAIVECPLQVFDGGVRFPDQCGIVSLAIPVVPVVIAGFTGDIKHALHLARQKLKLVSASGLQVDVAQNREH